MIRSALLAALPLLIALPATAQEAEPPTPASVVEASDPAEWVAIAPEDLLVMDLAPDAAGRARQVVIQLMPAPLSQPWVANVRTLAAAHWWDGTSVYRVVDNWVAQWGAGGDEDAGFAPRPLPAGVVSPTSSYEILAASEGYGTLRSDLRARLRARMDRSGAGSSGDEGPACSSTSRYHGSFLVTCDSYAAFATFNDGWPFVIGMDAAWPIHCYAHVGVARDLAPDTGTGAELYAVIGHAPRQLDRNIAVIGRVISGIEHLSTLPRGTGEAGVYEDRAEDTPIVSVRLGSDLPEAPQFEYLGTQSESFARYVASRANRSDAFYTVPAGGVDICNVQVPIRPAEL